MSGDRAWRQSFYICFYGLLIVVRCKELNNVQSARDLIRVIISKEMGVVGMQEVKNAYKILVGKTGKQRHW
jgi:hypothetical protein